MCPFDYRAFVVSGKVGFPYTGLPHVMAVVASTDRPKSDRNHCAFEVFGAVFVLSIGCGIFCWKRDFCHRT